MKSRAGKKTADWRTKFDAVSDEEADGAALRDPNAEPLAKRALAKMRRVSPAKRLRWKLGLSQSEFAERYGIPIGMLRAGSSSDTNPIRRPYRI